MARRAPATSEGYTAPVTEEAAATSSLIGTGRSYEEIVSNSTVPGVVEAFGLMNQLVPVLSGLDELLDTDITADQDYEIDTLMLMLCMFFDNVSARMSARAVSNLLGDGNALESLIRLLGEN